MTGFEPRNFTFSWEQALPVVISSEKLFQDNGGYALLRAEDKTLSPSSFEAGWGYLSCTWTSCPGCLGKPVKMIVKERATRSKNDVKSSLKRQIYLDQDLWNQKTWAWPWEGLLFRLSPASLRAIASITCIFPHPILLQPPLYKLFPLHILVDCL